MLNGIVIDQEGTLSTVQIDSTTSQTRLAGMYKALDCDLVDVVRLADGIDCWVDDEGLYNAGFNPVLTRMTNRTRFTSPLLGAGLFLGVNEATGETVSLTAEQQAVVVGWWRDATSGALAVAL
ncbi:DUF3846 domain-containing protein [Planctomonas sp. JC2975]|uniref:DUF3846 domain-containing protein n=1 Tax=Planctomonas sp. JC2975 TaxID=2729626 RepID=UPI001475D167|nr:DUF3846 domain-containing protein [Planctomonas sp. JC2975]NNC14067.1 DUF3846 domain-containing protein [Planctomonas sp. JC2975]